MRLRESSSRLSRKLRQNWRWGRTHGWRDLIEEHDWNPVVRGRRTARKVAWRMIHPDVDTSTPVFLFGAQRSGTNMVTHGLDEAPEFRVYNEGNRKAFRDFRLRDVRTITALVERGRSPFVLFKPLCDSHRAVEIAAAFPESARLIWAYRDVDGRVRSELAKFGDSNLRAFRAFAAGDRTSWQVQGMSSHVAQFVSTLDFETMSAESAAALFWYVRNSLYFDLGLAARRDALLISYNDFIAVPADTAAEMCRFLGLPFRSSLVAHVKARPSPWRAPLLIDPEVRARCTELAHRLSAARSRSVWANDSQRHATSTPIDSARRPT